MAFSSFYFCPPFPSSSGTCLHSLQDYSVIDLSNPLRIARRRISASFASTGHKTVQTSWIPADGMSSDGYGGWLIAEMPIAKKKREMPFYFVGALAASMSILLAAAASRSMSRTAYKYRFNIPLHALQELFVQAGTVVSISASVSSKEIQEESSSQMSDKVGNEYVSASIEKMEHVIVPVAPDCTQLEAIAVLKKLKIIEEDVTPENLCTRREYARWMVKLNSLLERNPKYRIIPSMFLAGSTNFAFDDVNVEDPDFWSIQALAEAGIVPSKLSSNESNLNGFKDQQKVEFLPESFLSRVDLVDWRAQIEYSLMPGMDEKVLKNCRQDDVQMLMKKVAFMDVNYIAPNASSVLLDLIGGEESICRKVFGNTRRLQPQKPATIAQAAVSLTVGRMREAIHAELSRIDAENSSRQAEMEEIRSEFLLRGEIQKFWAEKMDEEKVHRLEVEQDFQRATQDLEKEKIAWDQSMADFLKEKAALDCQQELFLRLKVEVNEMRERLAAERASFVAEQLSLGQLVAELQSKLEVLIEAKSRLEAEKEALRILRSWVEDEARRAQDRAKILEAAGRRWRWDAR